MFMFFLFLNIRLLNFNFVFVNMEQYRRNVLIATPLEIASEHIKTNPKFFS